MRVNRTLLTCALECCEMLANGSTEVANRIYIETIVSTNADGKTIDNTEN